MTVSTSSQRGLRGLIASLVAALLVGGLPAAPVLALPETEGLVLRVHNTAYDGGDCSDLDAPEQCNLARALEAAAVYGAEHPDHFVRLDLLPGATYPVHFQLNVPPVGLLVQGYGARIDNPDQGGRAFAIPVGADVEIRDVTFVFGINNGGVDGGCLHNAGTLVLVDVTFDGCTGGSGGAVMTTGDLGIERGVFTGNQGTGSGGALAVHGGAWVTVRDSTFENNNAAASGGAIHVQDGWLDLEGSYLIDNRATYGGGLSVVDRADVRGSLLIRNLATDGSGGAILFDADTEMAQLTLDRSSLIDNRAIVEGGAIWSDGNLDLVNTTLASNRASYGGALFQAGPNGEFGAGTAVLQHATITANTADIDYGGVHTDPGAEQTSVAGSAIVANVAYFGDDVGTDSNCHGQTSAFEFPVPQMVVAYSVLGPDCDAIDVGETSQFDVTTTQFGPLEFEGNLAIHRPLPEARVVDFVPEGCETADQVGTTRPQGPYCDAGAIELLQGATLESLSVTTPAQVSAGATIVPLGAIPPEAFVAAVAADPDVDADDTLVGLGLSNVGLSNVGIADAGLSNVGTSNPALGDLRLVDLDLPFTLAQLPLLSSGGWGACLEHDVLLAGIPLQALTVADVTDPRADPDTLACVEALTLARVDIAHSALADVGLLAVVLGDVPMTDITLEGSTATTTSERAAEWCAALETATSGATPGSCLGLDPATDSLTDATLVGAGLSNVGLSNVGLSNVGLSNVGLSNVGLSNVGLSNVGLSNVGLSNVDLAGLGLSNVGLSNVGLSNVGLSNVGLSNVGLSNVDLGAAGLSNVGLSNVGLSNVGLSNVGLSNVGLSNVDLDVLGLSNVGLSNVGLSNVGLSNVGLSNVGLSNVGLSNVGLSNVGAIPAGLSNVGLSNVGLSNVGLSNVGLGAVTLNALVAAGVQSTQVTSCSSCGPETLAGLAASGQLRSTATLATVWPYFEAHDSPLGLLLRPDFANRSSIESQLVVTSEGNRPITLGETGGAGLTVRDLVDALVWSGANVGDLVALLLPSDLDGLTIGDLIAAINDTNVLASITLGELIADLHDNADLAAITVGQLVAAIEASALAQVLLGDFLSQLDAALLDGLTLGQLLESLDAAVLQNLTLADLLLALLTPADLPWDDIDLSLVDWSQFATAGEALPVDVAFRFSGSPSGTTRISVQVPPGFTPDVATTPTLRIAGEPASGVTGIDTPVHDAGASTLTWQLVGAGSTEPQILSFALRAGLDTGPGTVTATVEDLPADASGSALAHTSVVEAFEPNDTVSDVAFGPAMQPTALYFTALGQATDQDLFRIDVQAAERVSLRLFGIPAGADVDLALWRVRPTDPAKPNADLSIPSGSAAGSTSDGNAATHRVEDVPPLVVPAGTTATLVAYSGQLGSADEELHTAPLAAGSYYVQVFGYNQNTSIRHVALQYERSAPTMALPPCETFSPLPGGTPGTLPASIPAGTNTLFVYNRSLYEFAHGAPAVSALQQRMQAISTRADLGIKGALIAVDGDTDVRAAYAAWHADRCSVDAALTVSEAVTDLLDGIRADLGTVTNVVLVGDDFQLPFWRMQDHAEEASQTTYASTFAGRNNEAMAAAAGGYFFSDDPYVSDTVITTELGDLHLPAVAIGRLVESHADITLALDNFLTYDGLLDPEATDTAFVTGYHFLTDGATELVTALTGHSGRVISQLIADTWTAAQLMQGWLGVDPTTGRSTHPVPEISSVNAHFSHLGLLTAIGDLVIRETGDDSHIADEYVVDVTEVAAADAATRAAGGGPALSRRLVMTMGCNSGMSVSDVQLGSVDPRRQDWAQTIASQGGTYVANGGFAYGDTDIVEYSERLYELIADNLDGFVSVGDAVRYAKQAYAARQFDEYEGAHQKVVMEVITFGLPMLRVPGDGIPVPLPTPPALEVEPATGQPTSIVPLTFEVDPVNDDPQVPNLARRDGSRGTFWTADGETIGSRNHPVQPLFTRDVTQHVDGVRTHVAHGVLPVSLSHRDVAIDDAHVVTPMVVDASIERESQVSLTGFPARIATVASLDTPGGERDQLAFVAGRLLRDQDTGQLNQRLFESAQLQVLYAAGDPATHDWTRPTITLADAVHTGDQIVFTVETTDAVGTTELVRVLYFTAGQPAPVQWQRIDLTRQDDGRWVGAVPALSGSEVRFSVFAADGTGNVGTSGAKGADHASHLAPPPGSSDGVAITLTPDPGAGGVADEPVVVDVQVDGGATAAATVNGRAVALPYTASADGFYTVTVTTSDGRKASTSFRVDRTAPVPTIASPAHGRVVLKGTPVALRFGCADASVVTECRLTGQDGTVYTDGQVLDTGAMPPGLHVFTLHARDEHGRTATTASSLRVITFTAPSGPHNISGLASYEVIVEGAASGSVDFGEFDGDLDRVSLHTDPVRQQTTASYRYTKPGLYVVTLRVDGYEFPHRYAIAYDPTGSFVTGGATIASPRGALRDNVTAVGEANVSFVAQYKKNTTIPTGNTNFRFAAGAVTFKSAAYEWLVVSGGKATYRGVGDLNGVPGYAFALVAEDGDHGTGGRPDRVRMRIWRVDDPSVIVYDNQEVAGGPPVALTAPLGGATAVTGGSIVIHERPSAGKKK